MRYATIINNYKKKNKRFKSSLLKENQTSRVSPSTEYWACWTDKHNTWVWHTQSIKMCWKINVYCPCTALL